MQQTLAPREREAQLRTVRVGPFRKIPKGVDSGIPTTIRIRSNSHVKAAGTLAKLPMRGVLLLHEVDKHHRLHRISAKVMDHHHKIFGEWAGTTKPCFFRHDGKVWVAGYGVAQNAVVSLDKLASIRKLMLPQPMTKVTYECPVA